MPSHVERERSRSPRHHERQRKDIRRRSKHRGTPKHRNRSDIQDTVKLLPFNQSLLTKHDLQRYRSVLAKYLDIQKGLDIESLEDSEVKGRWKSFLGKWNRGELARGWYDPQTISEGNERPARAQDETIYRMSRRGSREDTTNRSRSSDEEEDELGPALPIVAMGSRHGPTIPNFQDLQHKREIDQEDQDERRKQNRDQRKIEQKLQAERLNELAPRAEAGTRDRQIEKRREVAASNRAFAQSKDAETVEVGDRDLMGDDGGIEGYKARLKNQQRQKNEREIRKEEVLRARAAEREERLTAHREKEAKTMETLRMLAEQRYGSIS